MATRNRFRTQRQADDHLADIAAQTAMSAAARYLKAHGAGGVFGRVTELSDLLCKHVTARMEEALELAHAACLRGRPDDSMPLFRLTMIEAGVNAAKEFIGAGCPTEEFELSRN